MADKKPSDAELTRMQELTSAWIFRRALNDNKKYKDADDVLNDIKFQNEIVGTKTKKGIYPFVNIDWVETFFKQQKRFLDEFSNTRFKEFSVAGGFMDWVSKLVNQKYGINKKDAWDPADVWCIQNENEVKKQITNAISETSNIEVLNAELRTLFNERKVVGISLKKVASKLPQARYQEVNIKEGVLFTSGKNPTFSIKEIRCDLKLQEDGKTFKGKGSQVFFTVQYTKEKVDYSLTIRTSGRTYEPANLIFEFQEPGAAAQIGKAPVALIKEAARKHKMIFDNDWHNFPSTAAEFNSEKSAWRGVFNKIKNKVKTNITSDVEFIGSISKMLMDEQTYGTANSKLMQMNFLYNFINLGDKEMEKFITDLFFLAEKRGKGFGPFGKIY
jgi:hypothetical protein